MPQVLVTILAHNEERRIRACLDSLLREPGDFPIHVVVNGSTDATAAIAGSYGGRVRVRVYAEGGKSRSWNAFVLDDLRGFAEVNIFVDGDAEVVAGSIAAMTDAFAAHPEAIAVAGQPRNGRNVAHYAAEQARSHGIFGDLYALSGGFLAHMKQAGIRLPDDLIGDDGLLGALAKTNLANEDHWREDRVVVCAEAGFLCEPFCFSDLRSWKMQYKRLINYSIRHFQNVMISAIMKGPGPQALPPRLAMLYGEWLPKFRARPGLVQGWFDARALARMAKMARMAQMTKAPAG